MFVDLFLQCNFELCIHNVNNNNNKHTMVALSSIAASISISQILTHFNNEDVTKFKQALFQELGIDNDADFICKFLVYATKFIDASTLSKLNNEAQQISHSSQYPISKSNNMDQLSKLATDMRDVMVIIGSFLEQFECVGLGYVNRLLYIATQSKSFIINRRSRFDDWDITSDLSTNGTEHIDCNKIYLNDSALRSISSSPITGYAYNFEQMIVLPQLSSDTVCDFERRMGMTSHGEEEEKLKGDDDVVCYKRVKHHFFDNIFDAVEYLDIQSEQFMKHIPINVLFNKNKSKMGKSVNNLKRLTLYSSNRARNNFPSSFNKFIENYKEYFKNECDSDLNKIRKLETLELTKNDDSNREWSDASDSSGDSNDDNDNNSTRCFDFRPFFHSLRGNFEHLVIDGSFDHKVDYNCLIHDIIHPNLKSLSLKYVTFPVRQRIGHHYMDEIDPSTPPTTAALGIGMLQKDIDYQLSQKTQQSNNNSRRINNHKLELLTMIFDCYRAYNCAGIGRNSILQDDATFKIWRVLKSEGIANGIKHLTIELENPYAVSHALNLNKYTLNFDYDCYVRTDGNNGNNINNDWMQGWLRDELCGNFNYNSNSNYNLGIKACPLESVTIRIPKDATNIISFQTMCDIFVGLCDCRRGIANNKRLKSIFIQQSFYSDDCGGIFMPVVPYFQYVNNLPVRNSIQQIFDQNENGKVSIETDLSQTSMSDIFKCLFDWFIKIGQHKRWGNTCFQIEFKISHLYSL